MLERSCELLRRETSRFRSLQQTCFVGSIPWLHDKFGHTLGILNDLFKRTALIRPLATHGKSVEKYELQNFHLFSSSY